MALEDEQILEQFSGTVQEINSVVKTYFRWRWWKKCNCVFNHGNQLIRRDL